MSDAASTPDVLDLLTLAEAKQAVNQEDADIAQEVELSFYVTAISRRIDDLCGAVVKRTVTDEQYPGGSTIILLRQAPASRSATTTIGTVKEYSAGTLTTLSAEGLTAATAYDYSFEASTGVLTRRSSWTDGIFGSQRVVVTYSPGRYANTAAVDRKFKIAAAMYLNAIWSATQGVSGSATFGGGEVDFVTGNLGLAEARAKILLADELRPPGLA